MLPWLVIVPGLLAVGALFYSSVTRISAYDLSVTRLGITQARIRAYFNATGHLPVSLAQLPESKDRDNSVLDGWGRPIEYEVGDATHITLTSLGAEGSASPIHVTFDISAAN